MNIEQINKILSDYDVLIDLVKSKVVVLEMIDRSEYDTVRGIDKIQFEGESVYVTCDDTSWGCADYSYFEFPIIWLAKTDEELVEIVENNKKVRLETQRIKQAEIDEKVQLENQKREINEYNRLKAKFESKENV